MQDPAVLFGRKCMAEDKELWLELYRQMALIRAFEERVRDEYMKGNIRGMLHLYIGEEAVAVGACSTLRPDDYITSTHRGHGHCIAKGADIKLMMAELFGKSTGYCKGKGGSMHIADIGLGNLGANGIVGEGMPIAAGAGIAAQIKGTNQITLCFFGDGALNIGEFHESLNLAGLWKLPVVYICENNLYALSTLVSRACVTGNIARRAESYCIPGVTVDGMDVLAVRKETETAVKRAREGKGPSLLICNTYRFLGHGRNPDTTLYRTRAEEKEWRERCPVAGFRNKLLTGKIVPDESVETMEKEILAQVDESVRFAEESPYPKVEDIEKDIYA